MENSGVYYNCNQVTQADVSAIRQKEEIMKIRYFEMELAENHMELIGEYEDRCDGMVYFDDSDNTWIISTPQENYIGGEKNEESLENLIATIEDTMHEWEVVDAMAIAAEIAIAEKNYNDLMEKLTEKMEEINLDKSEKYEIQEMARMAL